MKETIEIDHGDRAIRNWPDSLSVWTTNQALDAICRWNRDIDDMVMEHVHRYPGTKLQARSRFTNQHGETLSLTTVARGGAVLFSFGDEALP